MRSYEIPSAESSIHIRLMRRKQIFFREGCLEYGLDRLYFLRCRQVASLLRSLAQGGGDL